MCGLRTKHVNFAETEEIWGIHKEQSVTEVLIEVLLEWMIKMFFPEHYVKIVKENN